MRALKQIDIHGRPRWRIDAIFMYVSYDANNGQQAKVAIHVSEFNGVADGILAEPALAREGCADDCNVRRVGAVAIVKDSSAKQRNSEGLKISVSGDAKIRFSDSFFLTEENVEIARQLLQIRGILGQLILRDLQKLAVGNAPGHGKSACGAHLAHARNLF